MKPHVISLEEEVRYAALSVPRWHLRWDIPLLSVLLLGLGTIAILLVGNVFAGQNLGVIFTFVVGLILVTMAVTSVSSRIARNVRILRAYQNRKGEERW